MIGLAAHQHIIRKYQSLASHAENHARSQLIRSLADVPVIRSICRSFWKYNSSVFVYMVRALACL